MLKEILKFTMFIYIMKRINLDPTIKKMIVYQIIF